MNESMLSKRSRAAKVMESTDPVAMLKEDHSNVKDLFDEFEGTDDERTQMQIAKRAINELKVHAAIEEEIFYPAVRSMVDDMEVMAEATEEHHVVHFLIDELEGQNLDHDRFHAKFMVLAENVRHHIKEEEGEMLPKVDAEESELEEIGTRMARRKQELMENPNSLNRGNARRSSNTRQTNQSGEARQSSRSGSSSKSSSKTSSRGGMSTSSRSTGRGGNKKSSKSGSSHSNSRTSNPRASR